MPRELSERTKKHNAKVLATKSKLKTLVVDRKKWGRSTDTSREGYLMEDGGKRLMCCLGFYCEQLGLKGLSGRVMPHELKCVIPGLTKKITNDLGEWADNTKIGNELARINDDSRTTDAQKETLIKAKFATIGVEVKFIN